MTKIRELGAAKEEGSLRPGDKLLQLNGQSLEGLRHAEVVELFTNVSNEPLHLQIDRQAESHILVNLHVVEFFYVGSLSHSLKSIVPSILVHVFCLLVSTVHIARRFIFSSSGAQFGEQ